MEKTNVMRILDQKKIKYQDFSYSLDVTNGEEVAKCIGKSCDCVFKTLVTIASDKKNYVFLVPVNKSLDLKAAAKAVKVKYVELIKQKDLLPLTGYIHGGCSPIGMKKPFFTVFDKSILNFEKICVSAGKIGRQVELSPNDLISLTKGIVENIKGEDNA